MPVRPTLPRRPLTITPPFIESEGTDKAAENMNTRVVRELVGWDAGPGVDGNRNVLTSATGAQYVNNYPLQRAPIPAGADLGLGVTVTEAVANENSYPNTMTILILRVPGVQGFIQTAVWNGNADIHGYAAGYQGFVPLVYNETQTGIVAGNILTLSHTALPEDNSFVYPLSAARNFD